MNGDDGRRNGRGLPAQGSGRGRRAWHGLAGGLFGALPGVALVLLTAPVSGEAELTLGVGGIFLAIVGFVAGLVVGGTRAKRRRR